MDELDVLQKMKIFKYLSIGAGLTLIFSACATRPDNAEPDRLKNLTGNGHNQGKFSAPNPNETYRDDRDILHCSIHKAPLTEIHGYWTGRPIPMISPTEEYIRYAGDYPNSIGLAESLSYSEFTPERHWFRYCKECQSGLKRALSKD